MNLVHHLHANARSFPDRIALIDGAGSRTRKVTYNDLSRMVGATARQLREAGLVTGDSIMLFQPVSLELYVFLLGVLHAGMIAVFLDPSATPAFVAQACGRVASAGFFGNRRAQLLRFKHPPMRAIRSCWTSAWFPGAKLLSLRPESAGDPEHVGPEHPALITFTSGSTGTPKAAMRSHGFLLAQHAALAEAIHLRPGQVDLLTLPVFALANLASGLTTVLPATDISRPAQVDILSLARQAIATGATRCAGSPALFRRFADNKCLPPFEAIYTGGAPVFPSLLDQLHHLRPEMAIHAVYGSTEAEPIADLDHADFSPSDRARVAAGSGLPAGRPTSTTRLAILPDSNGRPLGPFSPDDFDRLILPPNHTGEIVVSGDHVLPGYLDGIGDEETKIHVGQTVWHRTGDAGSMDEDGRVWLLGRCSAAVRIDNHPCYPFAIEAALDGCAGIERCALLEHREVAVLVVECPGPVPIEVRRRAADFGIHQVIAVANLPMDRRHQAKIDYPALRASLVRSSR